MTFRYQSLLLPLSLFQELVTEFPAYKEDDVAVFYSYSKPTYKAILKLATEQLMPLINAAAS